MPVKTSRLVGPVGSPYLPSVPMLVFHFISLGCLAEAPACILDYRRDESCTKADMDKKQQKALREIRQNVSKKSKHNILDVDCELSNLISKWSGTEMPELVGWRYSQHCLEG